MPGKPDQNAYIERFNRTYREEVLSAYPFDTLDQVRDITNDWLERFPRQVITETVPRRAYLSYPLLTTCQHTPIHLAQDPQKQPHRNHK